MAGGSPINGLVDELAIYKRALTAEEIADHYAAGVTDPAAPAVPVPNPVPPIVGTNTIVLSGTSVLNTSIWVNNKKIAVTDASGNWQGSYGTLQAGLNILNVTALDSSNRLSQPATANVFYDNIPPVVASSIPANGSNTAKVVSSVTINLYDANAGVDAAGSTQNATVKNSSGQLIAGSWATSGTNAIIFTPSNPFPQDTYTVTIYPVDAVGNKGQQQIAFTNHDTTAPVTKANLSGTKGSDGWYSTSVTVTLTATDGDSGSGVAKTEYSLDNVTWQLYSAPFVVDKDGDQYVYFRSTDYAGNVETPARSQEAKINKTGLVGLWHMDGDWKDASVVGNDGIPYGGVTFSPSAKIGTNAGSFNGVSSGVKINDSAVFQAMQFISVQAWINPGRIASSGTRQSIVSFKEGDNPTVGAVLALPEDATNKIRFWVKVNGVWQSVTSSKTLSANAWYHVTGTYDGTSIKIYVNGALDGATTAIGTMTNAVGSSSSTITIGARASNNTHWFQGLIDEVAIYNRPLSDTEIQASYRNFVVNSPTLNPVTTPTATSGITLSGTKPANTAIVVNGNTLVPLDATAAWQAPYTLTPGLNVLNVTALDSQNFNSLPATLTVVLDVTPPQVTATTPPNYGILKTAPSAITFALTDAFSPLDLTATLNGATMTSAGLNVDGTWSSAGTGTSGTVTFTPTSVLTDGTYTATIKPTDNLGNGTTYTLTFTIDTVPPPTPGIDPITVPINTTSKTITGTKSSDSASVQVSSAGATFGTVSYPTVTTWSVNVSGLKEGSNTVTASAVDAAGNQSGTASMTITVKTTPPAKPVINAPVSPTRSSSVTLTGTKDGSSYLYVNGQLTAASLSDTSWSYTRSLSEGSNGFSVYAKDSAGNVSSAATVTVVRDTTPPTLAFSAPGANGVTNGTGSVTVNLADTYAGVDLQGSLAGAAVKNSAGSAMSGSWSVAGNALVFTPAAQLPDGTYTVTLIPVDLLGNTGTATFSFTIDRTPPTVTNIGFTPVPSSQSPVPAFKAGTVTFTIAFSKAMDSSGLPVVTFTSGSSTYTMTGSWVDTKTWRGSYPFTGQTGDGSYTVTVGGAKDLAGNAMASQTAGTFVLMTTAPAAPTVGQLTTPTRIATQTITGTKPANSALVINSVVRVPLNSSTAWSYNYPLVEGANTLTVTARDAAGNDSAPITPAPVITLKTTPPAFTIDTYKNPSPTVSQIISGTKAPGCIVKLNGTTTIFDAADQNATWSYTLSLTDGITNHLVFTAADALGNTATKTLDILCDTAPPPALAVGMLVADGSGKGTEATLTWPSYIEPADLGYYRVYAATADFTSVAGLSPVGTVTKGTRTFKTTGLTQGTRYWFAVVPVSASGNSDPTIHTASAVPTDTLPPEDVTGLAAWAGYTAADGNTVTLSWTASANSMGDLADQVVYMDAGQGYDAGTAIGKTTSSYSRKGLNDATSYKLKVTTKDTLGHESAGTVVTAVTRLANPTGLTATPGSQKAVLAWSPVSSPYVKVYNVYRLQSSAQQTDISTMTLIKSQTGTSFTDTGLVNGTAYQYAVTVLNTSGAERTSVQSITASPRGDTTGPVVSGVNLTANQVITAPITITASAQDAESAMGRIDVYIDGVLATSQNGGSVTYAWNVVTTTDGNHTVKIAAYDAVGNVTEQTIPVVVSLAPPPTPVLTSTFSGPINQKTVTITGTAQPGTTITLRVNGVVVSSTSTSTSAFSFASVPLAEGDNLVAAKAGNRGGDSPFTSDVKVTVVTTAPAAPVSLAAKALAGGSVQFTWQVGASGAPVGYNLYEVPATFTALTDPGVKKTNSSLISYLLKEYIPADDTQRSYVVTAVDGAGNESPASNFVTIAADRLAPTATTVSFSDATGATPADNIYGPGIVQVALTVSEPLSEVPFFSLVPRNAAPIAVTLWKNGDTQYRGTISIDASSPNGPTTWNFSSKDLVGNRGNGFDAGPTIDVRGPVATITAPVTLLKTTVATAQVNVFFDEPSTTTPVLTLKAADGGTAQVTGLASTDNGLHWSGTLDPSALAEGTAQFLLTGAKDRFGNVGTTTKTGGSILLYKNTPPAPGIPTGLAAKPGKGGSIALSWTRVADGQGYNVYRQGPGDAAPVLITGIATGTAVSYSDTPAGDGSYAYSVSSLGLLNVESAQSGQVSAVSDRTPPPVPTGLALTMTGNGVKATWDAATPPAEVPASYRLYRAAAPFADLTGLTPVATATSNSATDPAPASSQRFYAVTALDSLGNESAPTVPVEITFPVAPVANLLLTLVDDGKPTLSWSPGEANVHGFYIYRNGAKINQTPTSSTSYSDGYYAGGTITYGVSAVDTNGTESPVKEATLPSLTVALKDGTTMHRGVLETVALMASIPAGAVNSLTIDAVTVKIGTLPESTLNGPFTVAPGTPLEIDKVAATEATAPPQEAVVVSAIMHPAPGTTVKLTRSSLAAVLGSGTALEIFNNSLVLGTTASVRIKVNNLGSARTEFLTSENGGPTSHVTVNLRDQDGNLLAQGNLNQRTGSVVNSGSFATARLEPGESFLSDPINFAIPATAPSKVSLETVIDATYYHYNQDDQVMAPGLKQLVAATISEVPYTAQARVDKTIYKQGESVTITGQALATADGSPVPLVPVKIGVSVSGFDRFFTATTDPTGSFSYTFTPGTTETGTFSVWATHPDLTDRSVQAQFSIIGLFVSPDTVNITTARNKPVDVPITIKNLANADLTGLTLTTASSSGIDATVVNAGSNTLAGRETRTVTFRITPQPGAPASSYANLTVATAEGLTDKVEANITLVDALPVISTAPSYIDTGLVRGNQKIVTFTISNTGIDTLRNARIEGPSLPWLSLTIDKNLGDLGVNQSKAVGILMNPGENIAQGVYNDRIVIYADNHIPYTYNIQVTVTSSAVGNVQFSVLDELMRNVANATITFQNQSVLDLIQTVKTGADGAAAVFDLPEGRYSFNISAPGANPYSGSFTIVPGITTTVPVGLELNLVQIDWSVTPTVIQDQYQITINQTFATNVPAPVLVTEPPSITFPQMQPGQVFNGEFTVTNYGLIAVDNVTINFPTSFDDYDVEILATTIPKRLGAMQKITVPYRITRRQAAAFNFGTGTNNLASFFEDVKCYGGGTCYKSVPLSTVHGTAVICPNTPQQRTVDVSTTYTGQVPTDCSSGGGSPSSNTTSIGAGGVSQGSSGAGVSTPVKLPCKLTNPCDCVPEDTPCWPTSCDAPVPNPPQCKTYKCKSGACTIVNDDGAACDDNKFCTSFKGKACEPGPDKCKGGVCVGKAIPDKNLGSFPSSINFAALESIKKVASKYFPNLEAIELTAEFKPELAKHCCETKQQVTDKNKLNLNGQLALPFGPTPVPYLSLSAGPATVGLRAKGTVNFSVGASATDDKCTDEYCWGGGGAVGFQATLSVGIAVPAIVEASVNGTTGGSAAIVVDCENARIEGQWDGISASLVWDIMGGTTHIEPTVVLVQPAKLDPINITMPRQ
jgi:hypothetical protein